MIVNMLQYEIILATYKQVLTGATCYLLLKFETKKNPIDRTMSILKCSIMSTEDCKTLDTK